MARPHFIASKKFNLSPDELRHLYIDESLSTRKIGARIGLSCNQINYWLQKFEIPIRKNHPDIKISNEELKTLYIETSLSQAKIAKNLGFGHTTICHWMKRYGIPARTPSETNSMRRLSKETKKKISKSKKGRPSGTKGIKFTKEQCEKISLNKRTINPKKEDLMKHYWDKKLSLSKIGKIFGVNTQTILNHMNRLSVPRRSQAECRSRELHPNWRGGRALYYGPNWREQRLKALERDNHTCQRCGITEKEIGIELDVHHILLFKNFGVNKYLEANNLDNLITLCKSCHMKLTNGDRTQ